MAVVVVVVVAPPVVRAVLLASSACTPSPFCPCPVCAGWQQAMRRVVFGPPHVLVDRLRGFPGATLAVSAALPDGVGRPGVACAGRLPL